MTEPNMEWEEEFDNEFPDSRDVFGDDSFGARRKAVKSFIRKAIAEAVEEERRRISEEAAWIESHKALHCRFDELVRVINPKK